MLEVLLMVAFWYGSSMVSATSSKQLLGGVGGLRLSALELTCLQMWMAALCGVVSSFLLSRGSLKQLAPVSLKAFVSTASLAAVFSTGFITLNLAYDSMSTSLANTLRAMEPLSSLVLAYVGTRESVSLSGFISICVIVFGACMASYGNLDFTRIGLMYCTLANFAFAYRTIQYREIRKDFNIDHATLFCQTSALSGVLLLAVLVGGDPTLQNLKETSTSILNSTEEARRVMVLNGVTFFLYLQLSFATLSHVTVVTHAILNSFRRPAVILFDVVVFNSKLSLVNMAGVALACVGVSAYSILKARAATTKATKRE